MEIYITLQLLYYFNIDQVQRTVTTNYLTKQLKRYSKKQDKGILVIALKSSAHKRSAYTIQQI